MSGGKAVGTISLVVVAAGHRRVAAVGLVAEASANGSGISTGRVTSRVRSVSPAAPYNRPGAAGEVEPAAANGAVVAAVGVLSAAANRGEVGADGVAGAATDGSRNFVGRHGVGRGAANHIGQVEKARLQSKRPGVVDAQFQRLIVRRAQEVGYRRGIAGEAPAGAAASTRLGQKISHDAA